MLYGTVHLLALLTMLVFALPVQGVKNLLIAPQSRVKITPEQMKSNKIKLIRMENTNTKMTVIKDLLTHQIQLLGPFTRFVESTTCSSSNHISSSLLDIQAYKSTQYLGEVGIGNDQWFEFIFDTGSAQVIVNSDRCRDPNCLTKRKYSESKSKTFKSVNKNINIAFGGGIMEGVLSLDTVSIGNLTIDDVVFAQVVHPSKDLFSNTKYDGVLGLALPGLAREGTKPIFDLIISSKKLEVNVFSFYFDRIGNYSKSFFMMGKPDRRFFIGKSLDYYPVIGNKYWQIRLDKVYIGDKETDLCVHGCTAIIDTGSSIISGPSESIYKLLSS